MVDAEAEFTAFFRAEYAKVVRTVTVVVGDRAVAEEIAQDAFIQLLDHWAKVCRYERPDAWVRRVAIRMASRAGRRDRLRRVLEIVSAPDEVVREPVEVDSAVYAAVRRLPLGQRTAVVLYYLEDRPVAEVADLMACSASTARVHLHKARRRLAELLDGSVDDVL